MLKRLDSLDVATTDLSDAATIYERNFGFTVARSSDGASATVKIGDAEVRLSSRQASAEEGMVGLWLEAEDLDQVIAALRKAGISPGELRLEGRRRVLAIAPKLSNQVPLFIFDRKT